MEEDNGKIRFIIWLSILSIIIGVNVFAMIFENVYSEKKITITQKSLDSYQQMETEQAKNEIIEILNNIKHNACADIKNEVCASVIGAIVGLITAILLAVFWKMIKADNLRKFGKYIDIVGIIAAVFIGINIIWSICNTFGIVPKYVELFKQYNQLLNVTNIWFKLSIS